MKSTHIHHGDARKTQHNKVSRIVGHTDHYQYPQDKAADMAYYQNEKLDPLTMPARESVGPIPTGNPPGSQLGRK